MENKSLEFEANEDLVAFMFEKYDFDGFYDENNLFTSLLKKFPKAQKVVFDRFREEKLPEYAELLVGTCSSFASENLPELYPHITKDFLFHSKNKEALEFVIENMLPYKPIIEDLLVKPLYLGNVELSKKSVDKVLSYYPDMLAVLEYKAQNYPEDLTMSEKLSLDKVYS